MSLDTYFGFSEPPFQDSPDQRFLFITPKHEAVLAELVDFITTHQKVALVTGDEGVGKTMLISALVERLPQDYQPLLLTNLASEPMALMVSVADAMGLTIKERNLVDLTPFANAVHTGALEGKFPAVIIDDAQLLSDQHLTEIWLLSQMEHQGRHLLPMVLVGRKGLIKKLDSHANQRLRPLATVRINLPSLTPGETILYMDHRLRQVGSSFAACFSEECSGQLFATTGGIPRRINQVARQALERCWQEKLLRVTRAMLGGERQALPEGAKILPKRHRGKTAGVLAGAALVVILAGYALYSGFLFSTSPPVTDSPGAPPGPLTGTVPEQALRGPVTTEPTPPEEHAEAKGAEKPGAPAPDPQAASPPEPPQVLPGPESSPEPKATPSATYQVTSADNLSRIVAKHYPDDKLLGFAAVLLANPPIIEEDIIYPGQVILLPELNPLDQVITVNGKRYYLLHKYYGSTAPLQKTIARLKEHQLQFLVRETQHPEAGTIYRLFLGGYEREMELKEAIKVAEGK